jgi:hypothetical protein
MPRRLSRNQHRPRQPKAAVTTGANSVRHLLVGGRFQLGSAEDPVWSLSFGYVSLRELEDTCERKVMRQDSNGYWPLSIEKRWRHIDLHQIGRQSMHIQYLSSSAYTRALPRTHPNIAIFSRHRNAARLARGTFALSTLLVSGFAAADTGLATADQQSVETRALKIVSLPEVQAQVETSVKAFVSLPLATDPEAQRALRPAIEELAFATTLDAPDSDPNRPKVIWAFTAPRTWLGHAVPGSRWGIDNPRPSRDRRAMRDR